MIYSLEESSTLAKAALLWCIFFPENRQTDHWVLDIYLSSHGFHLKELPFKSVYRLEIQKESPSGSDRPVRHGLQFGHLEMSQRNKLQYFLQNHPMEKVHIP